jgi:PEP-CTERM motif
MKHPMRCIRGMALAGVFAVALTPFAANATPLLYDNFSTGNLATSAGPGGGFSVASGDAAYESGGLAVVGGGSNTDENIYSNQTFNPAGTTLTWVVNSRPIIGAAGAMIGWDQSGIYACAGCGPEIWLEARNDRLVFDVNGIDGFYRYVGIGAGSSAPDAVYPGGSGPVTLSMTLTATTWQIEAIGGGNDVVQSGLFVPGFGPADVMAAAGGDLSAFASVRSDCPSCGPDVGTFSLAEITGVPEPTTLALFGAGLIGLGLVRRRG